MTDITERLRHAVVTASNDDYSEAGTEKRDRHVARLIVMQDASAEIERLRSELIAATDAKVEDALHNLDKATFASMIRSQVD